MDRTEKNPSMRNIPLPAWICNHCGAIFLIREEYLLHIEASHHRFCSRCGQNVGDFYEYKRGLFTMDSKILQNGYETIVYSHTKCPDINPSSRSRIKIKGTLV